MCRRDSHIDGIAEREGEAGNALGGPEATYGLQVGGKGRRAGARRKGDEPRFENAAEERGKRDTDHIFDQRAVTDDDVQDGRDGRDEDELAERQEHLEAMLADGVGNEAEHADGGRCV